MKDVRTGWISPLSGFENYEKQHGLIQAEIVGRTTSTGILITGQVPHFMQRVIGTMVDPPAARADEKRSVRYIGKNCIVTVTPDTGELIQTNLRKKGKKNA